MFLIIVKRFEKYISTTIFDNKLIESYIYHSYEWAGDTPTSEKIEQLIVKVTFRKVVQPTDSRSVRHSEKELHTTVFTLF